MTAQEKISSGKKLTPQDIAKRSRLALRTNYVNVGVRSAAPDVIGELVDNLIPKAILDPGPLIIRFDTRTITTPHDLDAYQLLIRKGLSGSPIPIADDDIGPVAGRPDFLDIPVPTAQLVDDDTSKGSTTWQWYFRFVKGADGNPENHGWFNIEIDRRAPEEDVPGRKFRPEAVSFVNLSPPYKIDDVWLGSHTSLDLTINIAYLYYRPDDNIDIYIGTNIGVGTPVYSKPLTSGSVSIPVADLPKLDGTYFIWYVLRDVCGNISDISITSTVNVERVPPPALRSCVIPKGISPDVIDLEDLKGAVYLEVPYTTNGNENDRIIPTVAVPGGNSIPLGSQTLGTDTTRTLQFLISTSRLLFLWGNATTEVDLIANYKFGRGVEPLVDSADTPSGIDFSYRGPTNPGFPGTENPDMVKVLVVGDSATPNHILSSDRGKDATISTPMVSAGNAWVPLGDETARLWYDGKEVFSVLLTAGAVTPLSATIDAADIDAAGPGKKIAYWTIEETGGRNVIKSFDTEVTVDPVQVNLPAPTVRLHNGFVSCISLKPFTWELPVTVPIDTTHMPTGTIVTIESVGTEDSAGLKPISGTEFTTTYRISGSETGGVFRVDIQPYLTKIKPIQPPNGSGLPNGYIKIWYSVVISGVRNPSADFLNIVSLLNDSFKYCEEA